MQSDRQHNPNRDFQRIQGDGPKSLHHKSRVRSLLGIPEDQDEGLGILSVPSVGLKYADAALIDVPYPSLQPPLNSVSAGGFQHTEEEFPEEEILKSDKVQQYDAEQELDQEESVLGQVLEKPVPNVKEAIIKTPSIPKGVESRMVEQEVSQEEVQVRDTTQEHAVEPGVKQEQPVIEPVLDVEGVSIEVPSVPEGIESRMVEQEASQEEAQVRDTTQEHAIEPEVKQEQPVIEPVLDVEGISTEIPSVPEGMESHMVEQEASQEEVQVRDTTQEHAIGPEVKQEQPVIEPVLDVEGVSIEIPSVPEGVESRMVEQEARQEEAQVRDTKEHAIEPEMKQEQPAMEPVLDDEEVSIEIPSVPEGIESRTVEHKPSQGEALPTRDTAREHPVEPKVKQEQPAMEPVLDVEGVSIEVPSVPEGIESRTVEHKPSQGEALSARDTAREHPVESELKQDRGNVESIVESESDSAVGEAGSDTPGVSMKAQNHIEERIPYRSEVLAENATQQRGIKPEPNQEQAITGSSARLQGQAPRVAKVSEKPFSGLRKAQGHIVGEGISGDRVSATKDIVQRFANKPVSRQAAEPSASPQKPEIHVQRTPIEVSGMSKDKPLFPDLSRKTIAPPHQAEDQYQQKLPRAGSVRIPLSEDQRDKLAVDSLRVPGDSQRREMVKGSPVGKSLAGDAKTGRDAIRVAAQRKPPLQGRGTHSISTGGWEDSRPDGAYPGTGFRYTGGFSTYNGLTAGTIEKLRRTVEELSSKVTKLETISSRAITQQPQQATVQPVVIVNRPASRVAWTRRFWERSYLGRSHLRPLR